MSLVSGRNSWRWVALTYFPLCCLTLPWTLALFATDHAGYVLHKHKLSSAHRGHGKQHAFGAYLLQHWICLSHSMPATPSTTAQRSWQAVWLHAGNADCGVGAHPLHSPNQLSRHVWPLWVCHLCHHRHPAILWETWLLQPSGKTMIKSEHVILSCYPPKPKHVWPLWASHLRPWLRVATVLFSVFMTRDHLGLWCLPT